jgi:molecular chaperone GrpE
MSQDNQHEEQTSKWEKMHQEQEAEQAQEAAEAEEALEALSAEELLEQVQKLSEEQVETHNKMLAAQAELQNVRRRAERDVEQAHKYGTKKLLQDLLPVLDSLIRATEGIDRNDAQVKVLAEGVDLTVNMLENTLTKHGVEMVNPEPGTPFNPETMEAMSMVPNPELPSNSVIQVLQKGYMLSDRVVRAAMVIVSQ